MRVQVEGSSSIPAPSRWTFAGLFTIALAILMFEILLTRIFSVTLTYHFAFVAISVAMFGMTVGAVLVYQFPGRFTHERARHQMAVIAPRSPGRPRRSNSSVGQ